MKLIEKEQIPLYTLIKAKEENSERWYNELRYAMRLGNEHKGKATITFETTEGSYSVTTTVWFVTRIDLELKGGIVIPLCSITDVQFT